MNLFMIPERIRLVVELGDGTLKLANRIVDLIDDRKAAAELAQEVGRDAQQLSDAIPKT